VNGTLAYGPSRTLNGTLPGTITGVPELGDVIAPGDTVYEVDNRPVVAVDGVLPMWRDLAPGVGGPDVSQLEAHLAALGYGGFTVDDDYTWLTAEAVRAWQEDNGMPETGTVAVGEILFIAEPIRVADVPAAPGDPANGPVIAYTGTERYVEAELDLRDQDLVEAGMAVTVTLPDGTDVAGEVGEVVFKETGGDAMNGDTETVVELLVIVDDDEAVGELHAAPVTLELVAEVREDVLAVPVEALVALREGGYGLEVVDGDAAVIVPVTTGLFANGWVEVTGDALAEGMRVGVPA
jgi:peptidoglycan hydrolase-like protein with peptidoglycan-binding domain